MNKKDLIAFEKDIAEEFNAGKIKAPIHLSGNNEDVLINIFKDFKPGDWVFSTWRSHYHALLAGVPAQKVKIAIMAGRSMTLCWPDHRFFSSAIFAGCCPIALGVAWQIKRSGGSEKVWLFLGDMAGMSGLAHECANYAYWNKLPMQIVIEDNGKSVCTKTADVWGRPFCHSLGEKYYFKYDLPFPHSGAGRRIQF
jgi:pyruvate dehydrogenase E1 component alpha subunit